jgi:hypothetical protein
MRNHGVGGFESPTARCAGAVENLENIVRGSSGEIFSWHTGQHS